MIREYEDSDAEAGSALIAEHSPWFSTPAGTRHRLASVVRGCAEVGISRLMTENDSENAGMLAINDELGFKPHAVMTEWVKLGA